MANRELCEEEKDFLNGVQTHKNDSSGIAFLHHEVKSTKVVDSLKSGKIEISTLLRCM